MLFNKRNGSFVPCGLPPEELPCHALKAWVSTYHTYIGCRRLQSWAEGMITEEQQRGFGNGMSCNLANSSLKGLSEHASKAECEVHICCVDFGKAYKTMARHLAWQLFQSLGFSYMVLQFITDLYKDTMRATQTDNDTPAICSQIVNGFKQGNVNAPSLLLENPHWSGQNLQVYRVQAG